VAGGAAAAEMESVVLVSDEHLRQLCATILDTPPAQCNIEKHLARAKGQGDKTGR
jgi:hypothetical protein